MRALERFAGDDSVSDLLAVALANVVPLVGVAALGWDAAVLVTVYWIELAVLGFWAVVRALLAGRPAEFERDLLLLGALADRPVAVSLPRTRLAIRLTTLPVVVILVPVLALCWVAAGAVSVVVLETAPIEGGARSTVVFATLCIFAAEGVRTAVSYVYRGGYREHSAQTAMRGVFWRIVALFVVGLATALLAAAADDSVGADDPLSAVDPAAVGVPLLVGIVCCKVAFDLATVWRDRLVAFEEGLGVEIGWAADPPTVERVDASLSNERSRVRSPLAGRLVATWAHAFRFPGPWWIGGLVFLGGIPFAFAGGWPVLGLSIVLAAGAATLLIHLDYWLRYGAVEYRTDGEALVAYDRLFKTALWRVEAWDESGLSLERDRLDCLLGTATVVIDLPDGERRLPRLREVEPVLTVFDRRPAAVDAEAG